MSTADGGNFTDSSATVEHQAQFSTVMSELITGGTRRRVPGIQRANTTAGCSATRPDPGPKPKITPRSHSVKRQDSPESDNQLNSVVSSMSDVMDMMMGRSPVVSPNSRRKLDINLPRHLRYSSSSDSSSSTTTAEEQMRPVKKKIRSRKSSKAGSRPISLAKELDLEAPMFARSSRSTIDRRKSSESPKPGGPKLSVCPSRDSLNDQKTARIKPSPDMSKLPSMTSTDISSSSDDGDNNDECIDSADDLAEPDPQSFQRNSVFQFKILQSLRFYLRFRRPSSSSRLANRHWNAKRFWFSSLHQAFQNINHNSETGSQLEFKMADLLPEFGLALECALCSVKFQLTSKSADGTNSKMLRRAKTRN
ncbi:unnamed protein product [Oikopleura dioica]|uniref:Uncharacterized protein n=1 Tax=Oikopleura dioica TaxID=34765 RepID=E4XYK3_OIKDI|nr:unnamed protein product [Oikopleura dioica]